MSVHRGEVQRQPAVGGSGVRRGRVEGAAPCRVQGAGCWALQGAGCNVRAGVGSRSYIGGRHYSRRGERQRLLGVQSQEEDLEDLSTAEYAAKGTQQEKSWQLKGQQKLFKNRRSAGNVLCIMVGYQQ